MENITQNDTSQNVLYLLIVYQQCSLAYDAFQWLLTFETSFINDKRWRRPTGYINVFLFRLYGISLYSFNVFIENKSGLLSLKGLFDLEINHARESVLR